MIYYQNEELNRIIKLRMANIHPEQIASITTRTKLAIDRILSLEKHRRGLTYPKLPHKDTKWNCARIEDMAIQTKHRKQKDLAKELKVSPSMISQLMKKRAMMIKEAYN